MLYEYKIFAFDVNNNINTLPPQSCRIQEPQKAIIGVKTGVCPAGRKHHNIMLVIPTHPRHGAGPV